LSRILAVAIDAPIRALFDYRAPRDVDPEALRPGMRLWVPFGRRRAVGVLVEHRASSEIAPERLRTVHSVIDDEPVLDTALLELLVWAADYYRHPVGEVLAAALPAPLRS
jgi:primosomal protein N' (replication factor Y)